MILEGERKVSKKLIPKLVKKLTAKSLIENEGSGAEATAKAFRQVGEPGLIVPESMNGRGASLHELVSVMMYTAAHYPSLGIMMTMHQHTVAGLCLGGVQIPDADQICSKISTSKTLIASAFSEAKPGVDILDSSVTYERNNTNNGYILNGEKKPCSICEHAEFFLVGVAGKDRNSNNRGLAIVDRSNDGVSNSSFWPSDLLSSAGSNCVHFDATDVSDSRVLLSDESQNDCAANRLMVSYGEMALSSIFQLLASACYLGIAASLTKLCLTNKKIASELRIDMLAHIETQSLSLYELARLLQRAKFTPDLLVRSTLVGHNTRQVIRKVVGLSSRAMGAFNFLQNEEAEYLVRASKCIDFHPPSDDVKTAIVNHYYDTD